MELNWKKIIWIIISVFIILLLFLLEFVFDEKVDTVIWVIVPITIIAGWSIYFITQYAQKPKEKKLERKTTKEEEIKKFKEECSNKGYQINEIESYEISVGKPTSEIPTLCLETQEYYDKMYIYKFISFVEPDSTIGLIIQKEQMKMNELKEIANNLAIQPERPPRVKRTRIETVGGDVREDVEEIPTEEKKEEEKKEGGL